MQYFGIIGRSLSHSFSPAYFKQKFKKENIAADYLTFDTADLKTIKQETGSLKNLRGLNVTIPYKSNILAYLDYIDPAAQAIAAVNCIKIENGEWLGFNTDWQGFKGSLEPLLRERHKQALILGNGGSSKAVAYALNKLNIAFRIVSRSVEGDAYLPYAAVDKTLIDSYSLLINTTPLGMFPHTEHFPDIPYEYLKQEHLLFDLIYNPEETLFLQKGKQMGAQVKNGLQMLLLQAEKAWDIWQGPTYDRNTLIKV